MSVGLARVTISAPHRRVDVALPEHIPLAELLPELLRHAGESLADDGERHGGWVLRRTDGVALTPAQGLFPQGVRDGEVLHLVPAREQWPELDYDDVVEAIAEGARRRGTPWSAAATRTATLTGAGILLGVGLLALIAAGPSVAGTGFVGLGVGLLLTVSGITASRAYGDARAGAALGGLALPYAFVGGAVLFARLGAAGGIVGPLPWLGGPSLLAGSTAVLLLAALGGAGVGASLRVFAAGALTGVLGMLGGLLSVVATDAGAAAVLVAVLVCGIGLLPVLAIRFGRLPTPPVTLPTGAEAEQTFTAAGAGRDAVRDRPDRALVFAAVSRTEELLTGMLIGHAVAAAGAFVVLAATDDRSARILVALAAAALLLHSRLFVTGRQRVPLLAAGMSGLVALGAGMLDDAGPAALYGTTVGAALLALATVAAGAAWSVGEPSPYLIRAADLLDALAVIAVIPVACAVVGIYGLVADLSF